MWQEHLGHHVLFIGLLLQGQLLYIALPAASTDYCTGESTLQPLTHHSCPNESVTFTCSCSQVISVTWEVKPYTDTDSSIAYIPSLINGSVPRSVNSSDNNFLSELIYFSRINKRVANMTTSLTVRTAGVRNGTNVTCGAEVMAGKTCRINATIYFTGL